MGLHATLSQEFGYVNDIMLQDRAFEDQQKLIHWLANFRFYANFRGQDLDKEGMFEYYSPQVIHDIAKECKFDGGLADDKWQEVAELADQFQQAINELLQIIDV